MVYRRPNSNFKLALILAGFVASMFGVAYASVPLYKLFCQVTGYGGVPQLAEIAPGALPNMKISIRFDANTNPQLPWQFKAAKNQMTVTLGEGRLCLKMAGSMTRPIPRKLGRWC